MSNNILKDFKPDIHIVIQVDTRTMYTKIESGNGTPINSLNLISICLAIAKSHYDAFLAQRTQLRLDKHDFFALAGESRCRVPRCSNEATHEIHIQYNSPLEPLHEFLPTSDNPIICRRCRSHKANHMTNVADVQ